MKRLFQFLRGNRADEAPSEPAPIPTDDPPSGAPSAGSAAASDPTAAVGDSAADLSARVDEGLEHHQAGRLEEAMRCYQSVLAINAEDPTARNMMGMALAQTGKVAEALPQFARAVQAAPDYPHARANFARALRETGQAAAACEHLEALVALEPDALAHRLALADTYLQASQPAAARTCFEAVLADSPQTVEARRGLGRALAELGEDEAALQAFEAVRRALPDDPSSHSNYGNALRSLGRVEEAAEAYRAALEADPKFAAGYNNLATIQIWQGDYEGALKTLDDAIALDDQAVVPHWNRGQVFTALGRYPEAEAALHQALALNPDHAGALASLGSLCQKREQPNEAVRYYERALEAEPDAIWITSQLVHQRQRLCAWDGLDALVEQVRSRVREDPRSAVPPWGFMVLDSTPAEQLQCASQWAADQLAPIGKLRRQENFQYARAARATRNRIRVGYLSGDFHDHPMMFLMAEMLELHDRSRFEVFAYSYGYKREGAMRKRAEAACEHFVDIADLGHVEAARRINADGIDILVDRKGYTRDARNEIVAMRPAPIQVNYLGYPGTMGAEFIDYLVADKVIIPPEQARHYAEQIVYMPDCYQANDTKRRIDDATPDREACGLPREGFVFCSFNQTYKITPPIFDIWMRLLGAVPGSVLWLLDTPGPTADNLRTEAKARGVDPARLVFAPYQPLHSHLARNRLADLFLDTRPVNAHTTASDALWAGLPVLTCPGETFVSRVAASLLQAIGLPELVTEDLAAYEARALHLATHPEALEAIKARLAANRLSAPLFDSERYTRHLEAAYAEMWRRYEAGESTQSIDVAGL